MQQLQENLQNLRTVKAEQCSAIKLIFDTSDNNISYDVIPQKGDPTQFKLKSLIIDATRIVTSPNVKVILGAGGEFRMSIAPGTFQSYQLPGFDPMRVQVNNINSDGSDQIILWFLNFDMQPQDFIQGESLSSDPIQTIKSFDLTAADVWTIDQSVRFAEVTFSNNTATGWFQQCSFDNSEGPGTISFSIVVPPYSTVIKTIWRAEFTTLAIGNFNTLQACPAGTYATLEIGY